MEEAELTKKDILSALVLDEKDTLNKLKELVEKSKNLIRIEGHTGKTILVKSNLSLRDKIVLLAIGKYFAKELDLSETGALSFEEMKTETASESQALSRPLGTLLKENILEKNADGYLIKYYQIEASIDSIIESKPAIAKTHQRARKASVTRKEESPKEIKKLVPGSISKLAEKASMDEAKLKHIFEFEENDVRIIMPIEGRSEGDRQLKATLLYLVAYDTCFNLREVNSSDLRQKLQDLGIRSLVNLSTQLKGYPNFIWHKIGKTGSTSSSYKITTPGEIEGIRLLKELGNKLEVGEQTETTI